MNHFSPVWEYLFSARSVMTQHWCQNLHLPLHNLKSFDNGICTNVAWWLTLMSFVDVFVWHWKCESNLGHSCNIYFNGICKGVVISLAYRLVLVKVLRISRDGLGGFCPLHELCESRMSMWVLIVVIVVYILLAPCLISPISFGEQFNGFTWFHKLCGWCLWSSHAYGTLDV